MLRKLLSIVLAVWVLLMLSMPAAAQSFDAARLGSVSVTLMDQVEKTPISGAELSLYYVASVEQTANHDLIYTFTKAFETCGCALADPKLSTKLEAFVQEHAIPAERLVTDARGSVSFANLPLGLYFVMQTNTVAGYSPCTSFLVTVPNYDTSALTYMKKVDAELIKEYARANASIGINGTVLNNVNASPKTDIVRLTDITIKKVWNTAASASETESVTIQLLRDGVVIETAILNDQNHWQVTYTNMPESDAYSIVEVHVPKGFTATYSQNGYTFTVTNSTTLIQTGQLIWPIPVLAMTGLCLITAGTIVLRKTRNTNA